MKKVRKMRKGDTLIEVTMAIAVFSLVSVISINLMDRGVSIIQGTLELTMTRNEIDAQAEALRYIQNSFLSERELVKSGSKGTLWQEYFNMWRRLTDTQNGLNNDPRTISTFPTSSCSDYYNGSTSKSDSVHTVATDKAFVINTRSIDPTDPTGTIVASSDTTTSTLFHETPLYPRLVFSAAKVTTGSNTGDDAVGQTNGTGDNSSNLLNEGGEGSVYDTVYAAEGIWIIATRDVTNVPTTVTDVSELEKYTPQFFDFHIRSCWNAPGDNYPSSIATIIRLYNPEYVEKEQ